MRVIIGMGLGGGGKPLRWFLTPKFVLTPQKIVKISQKYIAAPAPLVFPQIEYWRTMATGHVL